MQQASRKVTAMDTPRKPPQGSIDAHIGKRIAERRVELGWHQDDLARALGITWEQVMKYESGANLVPASRLYELSRALNVPVAWFFRGAPGVDLSLVDPAGNDPILSDIVEGLRTIKSSALRTQAIALLRVIIEVDQERATDAAAANTKLIPLRRS